MLRFSKKADYALMAMKHLAVRGDAGSSSAREIAAEYNIPIELLAKVLQRLVRTGLLISTQGTRGGYTLSRSSAAMSASRPRRRAAASASISPPPRAWPVTSVGGAPTT